MSASLEVKAAEFGLDDGKKLISKRLRDFLGLKIDFVAFS